MVAPLNFPNRMPLKIGRHWYRTALAPVQGLDGLLMHVESQGWEPMGMCFSGIVAPPPANILQLNGPQQQGIPLIAVTFSRKAVVGEECPEIELPGGPQPLHVG